MNPDATTESQGLEVRTYFVRGRNALVARADFGDLYVDYYLHQGQHARQHEPAHDEMLKEALAALTLHCASRPWNEACAWTIHFVEPLVNLFLAGDNRRGTVVGQVFTENVKDDGQPLFLADLVRERGEPRRSVVALEKGGVFPSVERLYAMSEQRPARYFRFGPEDFVMVTAQPQCDMKWFEALDDAAIQHLDQAEQLSLLEQRRYRWECGCNQERMLGVLGGMMRADPEGLFAGEESLRMSCPRCGARYLITRESLEAYIAAPRAVASDE
jgi:molecular chaperone Hsp33